MEGGAGVSPTSSCTDSSSGSQPGSKAPCSWAGKPFGILGPCELLCLFGPEKCSLVRNKTYKTLPQQTKPTIPINETVSLGKSGPCRGCHLATGVNTLLLSSGSPRGTAAKDRGWHLGRQQGVMAACLYQKLHPFDSPAVFPHHSTPRDPDAVASHGGCVPEKPQMNLTLTTLPTL